MEKERISFRQRPRWMIALFTFLPGLVTFFIFYAIFLFITSTVQKIFDDLIIDDLLDKILLAFVLLTSIYISSRITNSLNIKLEKRSLETNFRAVIIVLIITILTLPLLVTYITS